MAKKYLQIENDSFCFLTDDIHDISETDIYICDEDYNLFFELQSQGKQFRLKEVPTGNGLFDYIERYLPEVVEVIQEPGLDEFMLDIEYRISKLELEV